MHANHLLFSVEIIFNSCQSFVLLTSSSSFSNFKGGHDRQCDFINKFCLLSVLMYTKWQYQSTVGVYRIIMPNISKT